MLAAVIVTVATPLGSAIWSYLLSFQNQAISLASTEWESAFSSPLAVVYLSLAACFAAICPSFTSSSPPIAASCTG